MRDRTALAQLVGPPDLARTWQQAFPGTPEQLRQVRAALRTVMDGCAATDDLVLLVSEMAANAIVHSASGGPDGTFTVRVRHVHGDYVDAAVRDAGSEWDGEIASAACHPHGLYLLLALADACGTVGSARSRTVWFRLDEAAGRGLR